MTDRDASLSITTSGEFAVELFDFDRYGIRYRFREWYDGPDEPSRIISAWLDDKALPKAVERRVLASRT